MSKIETVDLSLININPELYPRAGIDPEVVATYSQNMEAGAKFDPLVVQKETYTLIDGVHRYHALKKLGRKEARVEILDIPDSELRAEAIRRNVKHGKRLTRRERTHNIIALRYKDEKSEKEIAGIVGLTEARISQICQEWEFASRYFDDFSDLNPKETKIDLRYKLSEKQKQEILTYLDSGQLSGKEIATKYNVSQSLISQIKKKHEEWKSCPVYIKTDTAVAMEMFRIAFMNRLLKKARLEFKKEGVVIRNSKGKKPPLVVAMFNHKCFMKYQVKQPIDCYIEPHIMDQVRNVDVEVFELAMVNPRTWKIRWKGYDKKSENSDLDWRGFPPINVELDKDGLPTTCTVKAKIFRHEFPGNQKGEATFMMKDRELSCSFKSIGTFATVNWECNKKLELEFIEKTSDARAVVDLATLNQVVKIIGTPIWLGMWSDRTQLALGYGSKIHRYCFII